MAACSPAEQSPADPEPIRFALDWSLNTNHIGLVVADERGYFSDVGLEVELLPPGTSTPIERITAQEADFGISEQTGVQISRAQGQPITSVFQVVQKETGVVIFDDEREDITRPADLDGLTFGGFGDPIWTAVAGAVITGDGGEGVFDDVVLDLDVYEALNSGAVDFTLSVVSWENILAEMQGRPYGTFRYQDFGVPENHTISIVGADEFISDQPGTTRDFVQAIQRGYAYAVDNPSEAADILIEAYPDLFDNAAELVHASTSLLADGYFVAAGVEIGAAQPQYWDEYGDFLLEQGMLFGPDGAQLDAVPDWTDYYTNEFLAG